MDLMSGRDSNDLQRYHKLYILPSGRDEVLRLGDASASKIIFCCRLLVQGVSEYIMYPNIALWEPRQTLPACSLEAFSGWSLKDSHSALEVAGVMLIAARDVFSQAPGVINKARS